MREERPDASENRPQAEVVLGTIAAPGLAGDVTTRVAEELAEDLARSYGAVGWRHGARGRPPGPAGPR